MIRRSAIWAASAIAFGVLSLVTIPAPMGVLNLDAAGHGTLFWGLFAAVAVLDVTVLRRITRPSSPQQVNP